MLRRILTFAALIMFACAATAAYSLTFSDGFESGKLSDNWVVVGPDPPAGDAVVKHLSQGAIVRSGQYSMLMYANGVDDEEARWPNLVFGDEIPREGRFEAYLRRDEKAGSPQLWLEATYLIEGVEDGLAFLVPTPTDTTSWHKYSIFYDPDYDAENGSLTAFYDGGLWESFINEDLKGGQFTGGGFIISPSGGHLKYWLDDCGIYVAPEPSSMMALGCGLFGLAGAVLKRRR